MTPHPELQEFAALVSATMSERGLRPSHIAREIWGEALDGGARNRDAIGHYMRGTRRPNAETLRRLAEVLEIPLAELASTLPDKPARAAHLEKKAMPDVLDYLRTQFARMDNRFDSIERKLDELTMRLSSAERELAGMRGDIAILHHRVDNLDRRMSRIERRLELGALEERQ